MDCVGVFVSEPRLQQKALRNALVVFTFGLLIQLFGGHTAKADVLQSEMVLRGAFGGNANNTLTLAALNTHVLDGLVIYTLKLDHQTYRFVGSRESVVLLNHFLMNRMRFAEGRIGGFPGDMEWARANIERTVEGLNLWLKVTVPSITHFQGQAGRSHFLESLFFSLSYFDFGVGGENGGGRTVTPEEASLKENLYLLLKLTFLAQLITQEGSGANFPRWLRSSLVGLQQKYINFISSLGNGRSIHIQEQLARILGPSLAVLLTEALPRGLQHLALSDVTQVMTLQVAKNRANAAKMDGNLQCGRVFSGESFF
ncbi:MAG: hypothetical protein NZ480_02670 [Bdellovibrionaceae bacterium]|nr:hypothetical protein [Pseudobdellovibrionaceae bacterium]MDW8189453.1 hypothetical protein [Pseudobdellovibrionaceae bacterium]